MQLCAIHLAVPTMRQEGIPMRRNDVHGLRCTMHCNRYGHNLL
jgi:hypothetical protein